MSVIDSLFYFEANVIDAGAICKTAYNKHNIQFHLDKFLIEIESVLL